MGQALKAEGKPGGISAALNLRAGQGVSLHIQRTGGCEGADGAMVGQVSSCLANRMQADGRRVLHCSLVRVIPWP